MVQGLILLLLILQQSACGRSAVPDPREVAQAYEDAVERGDVEALHALLSEDGQTAYSREDVRSLLERDARELRAKATSVADEQATVVGSARVVLADRREVELTWAESRFWVQGTLAVPLKSETPEVLLQNLALALESKSLPLMLSLLTQDQRLRVEERLEALVESLQLRQGAVIRVNGDRAEVELPDGQVLGLVREEGSWQVGELP